MSEQRREARRQAYAKLWALIESGEITEVSRRLSRRMTRDVGMPAFLGSDEDQAVRDAEELLVDRGHWRGHWGWGYVPREFTRRYQRELRKQEKELGLP